MQTRYFLFHLAGSKSRLLHGWLDNNNKEPRIAWYPSAGGDFRDLLYLNPNYSLRYRPLCSEPEPPTLFLHTDVHHPSWMFAQKDRSIFDDGRTSVRLLDCEELQPISVFLARDLVVCGDDRHHLSPTFFMLLEVTSRILGSFTCPLLYILAENAAFCSEFLLPQEVRITHLIQICYGHGIGGSHICPHWLLNQLGRLQVETVVWDGPDHRYDPASLEKVSRYFPNLGSPPTPANWTVLHNLPRNAWRGYANAHWYRFDVIR